ncbi:MAG: hypothetical protein HYY23_07520 [Verrucomicrobia bacterium]|nr:hypothetical protein [Verrucomicrobiota bacterium]
MAYLAREVPRWSRENHCFSCHNNGDAARALYVASSLGYPVPRSALAETTAWLRQPDQWENNKGDPGFSDKRLAAIQFTAALATAIETKQVSDRSALLAAARKLAPEQNADGAWLIEPVSALGSPATYGTHLATVAVLKSLADVREPRTLESIRKAEAWLLQAPVVSVLDSAAVLMGLRGRNDPESDAKRKECRDRIQRSQTHDGGWGPYADSPPEPFDTAVALLALAGLRPEPEVEALIRRGRQYLVQAQLPDGSWPETTRPARGESYAQRISTTGWATLALLKTKS